MSDEKWASNAFDEALGMGNHQTHYTGRKGEGGILTLLGYLAMVGGVVGLLWLLGF